MNKILEKLGQYGIVPVVVLNDSKDAEPLADALCEGGLACAEVTFRTEAAAESIRIMSEKQPRNVSWCWYSPYNRTGRRIRCRWSKIYRKPWIKP